MWFYKEKTSKNKFKLALFIVALITCVMWLVWFGLDMHFVSITTVDWEKLDLNINPLWKSISLGTAASSLALIAITCFMEMAYIVIIGRKVKENLHRNIYEIAIHFIVLIGALITMCISTIKFVNDKWLLDLEKIIQGFDNALYHMDLMNTMSVSMIFVLLGLVAIGVSGSKGINVKIIMQETNVMLITFMVFNIIFYPFFIWKILPPNGAVIGEYDIDHLFPHLTGALFTTPMGITGGAMMCIMLLRMIANMFLSKKEINKKHIIIYSIILVLISGAFIAGHAAPIDFDKLARNEAYVVMIALVSFQTATCMASGIYASISVGLHDDEPKTVVAKPKAKAIAAK